MEEALGADGHGFLEQHDALIGLVAEKLQGGKAARRRHVEMLPAARGYDKAFCCAHVGVLPRGGMRINAGGMNVNVHESRNRDDRPWPLGSNAAPLRFLLSTSRSGLDS